MTQPTAYLAFDLGASSGRAILGRLDAGRRMDLHELHRFPTPLVEQGDRLYWDAERLWEELQTGLRLALSEAADLRSVSVDSWAVDYVPLDADGRRLRQPFCYRDPVRADQMDRALAAVDAETIYRITGIQFLPFNTLYQVLADREDDPDVFTRTANRLLIADYLNHRLGGRAVVDRSMASTTQALDAATGTWSRDLLTRFDLPPAGWPEIVACGTRIGMADEAPGVAVVAGCSHDTACAIAATPATGEAPWCYISCGTWSLMGVERAAPLTTAAAREAGFTNEIGLDDSIRFLKNLTGLWVLQECVRHWREAGEAIDYAPLMDEAAALPSPTGVLDLEDPRFLNRGAMPDRLRAACGERGLVPPSTRAGLARLVVESIADSYRRTLNTLEALTGESIETIHLVGGGARNTLLCRLTAERCGRTVVAGPFEATALGNLLVQARTMGDLPDGLTVRDAARASSDLTTYTPS